MSQELKLSSEPPPTTDPYVCVVCDEPLLVHAYKVQRRKVRPVIPKSEGGTGRHDGIDTWHDGIQVGPEFDYYCTTHYDELPSIQELLDDFHKTL